MVGTDEIKRWVHNRWDERLAEVGGIDCGMRDGGDTGEYLDGRGDTDVVRDTQQTVICTP